MPVMAKRKSKSKQARSGLPLHVWLEPALRHAIDVLKTRNRRSLTSEVSLALERHLAESGLWPPPPSEPSDTDES